MVNPTPSVQLSLTEGHTCLFGPERGTSQVPGGQRVLQGTQGVQAAPEGGHQAPGPPRSHGQDNRLGEAAAAAETPGRVSCLKRQSLSFQESPLPEACLLLFIYTRLNPTFPSSAKRSSPQSPIVLPHPHSQGRDRNWPEGRRSGPEMEMQSDLKARFSSNRELCWDGEHPSDSTVSWGFRPTVVPGALRQVSCGSLGLDRLQRTRPHFGLADS